MYNFPEDSINGWLQVIKAENEIIVKQIFYRHGTKNSTGNYTYIRTSYNDGWSEWVKLVTNIDFGYIECTVNTQANIPVEIPNAPPSRYGYVPVIIAHISTNLVQDTICFDVNKWWITSTVSQETRIVFYKMPY